jgi:hypothetical protein
MNTKGLLMNEIEVAVIHLRKKSWSILAVGLSVVTESWMPCS